ncbi:hypothetical protein [Sphingomonas kyeonggiensis]|uniref:Uncharacterized protein n=1 Tax=Sphingomonas kyeonggiensis TaxID=1268553 RepID=A0A7W6JX57_9SPHN|nr:hypothetical protein [Sphingomonas kyeonggiensis]MBB4101155.1 hypothetical protein [Sphingomonas kyeonggiensis]
MSSLAVQPPPIRRVAAPTREWLLTFAGLGLSAAILLAVLAQLGGIDPAQFRAAPTNIWFWLCFALVYANGPLAEWIILRRLWGLRVDALPALFRKQVANEIVFGYSGEAQFYLWARRRQQLKGSVFGTLRDVAVLSALAGNLATLVMMAINAPLLYSVAGGTLLNSFAASIAVIILSSLAILLLRRTAALLTLSRRDLAVTFALHSLRIVLGLILTALLWKLLLPGLSWTMLVAVATLRMMVHRLPLVPARDALLAPLTLALLGPASGLAAATMLVAALTLVTHIAVGALTSIASFLPSGRAAS